MEIQLNKITSFLSTFIRLKSFEKIQFMNEVRKKVALLSILLWAVSPVIAQSGIIKGRVYNSINNESIPFANVGILSLNVSAPTDLDGNYELKGLVPGLYNISVSYVGYRKKTIFEIQVNDFTIIAKSKNPTF